METLRAFLPKIEAWCDEVETNHFVLTVLPGTVTIAALTPAGVVQRVFRTEESH